ncbi:RagB/SusD family nutrient uptake outer membrane protein [Ferruginibacter sp.]|uniref:RagB/SusD family nutrient uptake outer membrane protein n=1 Tax=Ferruginibacter sp. TaxID=1940288 RepID=UPI00374CA02C
MRTRAGLLPVANAGIPQLIHERRVELDGENTRWQDLLRWDKDKIINLDTIVNSQKPLHRCLLLIALWLFLPGYLYDRNIIICQYRSKLLMKAKM